MKVTYSYIIYSCIIFGTGIQCDRKLERRQTVSSCSGNTDDNFNCSNGQCIEWPLVCDGLKDCSDGSDETNELCAIYEFGTNMTMDCGRVNIKNQNISEESSFALAPWNVKVQQLTTESSIKYICMGTIIAPNIVISVGSMFWNYLTTSEQMQINDGRLKISFNHTDAIFAEIKVVNIIVFVLANKFSFDNGFMPICIDWFNKYDLRKKDQMTFILTNKKPMDLVIQGFFPYTNNMHCTSFMNHLKNTRVNDDKLCITLKDVPDLGNITYGMEGSGFGVLHSTSNFLNGVLTGWVKPKNLVKYLVITEIQNYVPWIRGIFSKHVTVNSCVLPTAEGVVYSFEGSNETLSHGTIIDRYLNVIENCEVGYYKSYTIGFRYCTGKGKWLSSSHKLCYKMCPPLEADNLDFKCTLNGKYCNCSNLSIPNTIATQSCKQSYFAKYGEEDFPPELVCQPNGIWNNRLYRCNPYCGKPNYKIINGMINDSETALNGTAPWNVGVYQFHKTTSNYDLICGGSIISANLVVSVAHCFWENGMSSRNISINYDLYKISVGKYSRNITIIDNIEFTKIRNVEIVYLHEHYSGPYEFHANDLAIIVVRNRISFSIGVAPVCVDWNNINTIPNGAKGKIVIWGKTEKGIESSILVEASLPYIDHNSCRDMYTNGFQKYVTIDKFCAGSESGQEVSDGNSGAGLSFIHSKLYYLTGIASVKDPETNNSVTVFTEIRHHIQWIRRLHDKHN
ncbi:uncharacterized protein LOC132947887 isoform X2 [Metopolophium dirhodum]|uniref:uncharacterized protein LOC132947887 isoform X2 n=1 Tax=Metopolophium dirhodum TaxID=44670 RepID=UPI00298FA22F|nr:uncharacterized protein LOC132947887 isoform X2 [Metopolophium dirhodum]